MVPGWRMAALGASEPMPESIQIRGAHPLRNWVWRYRASDSGTAHALHRPAACRPGLMEGCGAPGGHHVPRPSQAAQREMCRRRHGAPRGVFSLAPSPPRVFVLLPDAADNSHITASRDGLGALSRRMTGVTPSHAWAPHPRPVGNAGRTPSTGGNAANDTRGLQGGDHSCVVPGLPRVRPRSKNRAMTAVTEARRRCGTES